MLPAGIDSKPNLHSSTVGSIHSTTDNPAKSATPRHVNSSAAEKASSAKRFKELSEAYDILGDSSKREMYNRGGRASFRGGQAGSSGYSHQQAQYDYYRRQVDPARMRMSTMIMPQSMNPCLLGASA